MRITAIFILALGSLVLISCKESKQTAPNVHIIDATIKETPTEIISRKTIEGYLVGVNWEKNEIYVNLPFPVDNKCVTSIIDPRTGEEKKKISFSKGDSQSPTQFTSPSYIEYLSGKYYVFDHLYKIVVYDDHFDYLYTGMFYNFRIFVDFYTYENDVYFMFCKSKNLMDNYRYNIQLYRLPEGKKPDLIDDLYESFHESPYPRNGRKYYHIIFFRSSNWGFEKNGNIFYADNREKKYYRYNLVLKKTEAFELAYLHAKKYSQEEAEKAANYKNMDRSVKGLETIIVPAAEATYHQGLYDLGKDKIGVAADIDMNRLTFRLDVLDSSTGQYRFSIRLPLGEGFLRRTSSQNLGYLQSYINVDKGFYVWPDLSADLKEGSVHITRFKLPQGAGNLYAKAQLEYTSTICSH